MLLVLVTSYFLVSNKLLHKMDRSGWIWFRRARPWAMLHGPSPWAEKEPWTPRVGRRFWGALDATCFGKPLLVWENHQSMPKHEPKNPSVLKNDQFWYGFGISFDLFFGFPICWATMTCSWLFSGTTKPRRACDLHAARTTARHFLIHMFVLGIVAVRFMICIL